MSAKISASIKKRDKPKDVFYTPLALVEEIMPKIVYKEGDILFDGFYGKGVFYNNYPDDVVKVWTEISMDKDFFEHDEEVDYCYSNPPYSMINKVLEHTTKICRKGFGYLFHFHSLTHSRLRKLEEKGFYLRKLHICKVDKWYGHQAFVVFLKEKGLCEISYSLKNFKIDLESTN